MAPKDEDARWIPIFKGAGIEIINFPVTERAKLIAKAAGVWDKWLANMASLGYPEISKDILNFAKAKRDEIMAGIAQ